MNLNTDEDFSQGEGGKTERFCYPWSGQAGPLTTPETPRESCTDIATQSPKLTTNEDSSQTRGAIRESSCFPQISQTSPPAAPKPLREPCAEIPSPTAKIEDKQRFLPDRRWPGQKLLVPVECPGRPTTQTLKPRESCNDVATRTPKLNKNKDSFQTRGAIAESFCCPWSAQTGPPTATKPPRGWTRRGLQRVARDAKELQRRLRRRDLYRSLLVTAAAQNCLGPSYKAAALQLLQIPMSLPPGQSFHSSLSSPFPWRDQTYSMQPIPPSSLITSSRDLRFPSKKPTSIPEPSVSPCI
ncbi:uncharacterized protein LOC126649944 isoform X2 [Myiozetetes cayanensis]|uniref:uncharacterized protein LOC126649944 isoform X2 n=1 Tax=Myiozetetes cayanensis TaxID=478635 RepID=UPI002160FAFA|nr:uncharacterized protein LOC126649944 isoform X2 [Myiozetetes cayanensis]